MNTLEYLENFLKTTPTYPHWQKIQIRHHHGICTPLFSLRTKQSVGIGEYLDLIKLIDWAKMVGFEIIQLLPLNDTGEDPSPYNALSSKALHPIYLSLHALNFLDQHRDLSEQLANMSIFNEGNKIAYPIVLKAKYEWLKAYFSKTFHTFEKDPKYKTFLLSNPWLKSYALYRTLKEQFKHKPWYYWPDQYRKVKHIEPLFDRYQEQMHFYCFLQYLSYLQMTQVKEYAELNGIKIKGDIPILLSSDSADVWEEPHLFNQTLVAGAPPDAYSAEGQVWGFPLFNWKMHEKDHFAWWKQRLGYASQFYHLYRIDHVVGFFRIWAIPLNKKATDGSFKPKNIHLWPLQGKRLLKMMIETSCILPIAEDLGTIPKFVFRTLENFGICGTRVIRWQRRSEEDGKYIPIQDYEPLTVTTVSTHDSEPLSLWWQTYPLDAKLYAEYKKWNYQTTLSSQMREEILYDAHHSNSLFHINLLQEYLALFPELCFENPQEERINTPGTTSELNWTYRYRPYMEEVFTHDKLTEKIKKLLSK